MTWLDECARSGNGRGVNQRKPGPRVFRNASEPFACICWPAAGETCEPDGALVKAVRVDRATAFDRHLDAEERKQAHLNDDADLKSEEWIIEDHAAQNN